MGVNVFPSGGGGSPIKSIQRGVASSAGDITISAVDTSKTMVRSFSTGSAGSVAARGTVASASFSGNTGTASTSLTLYGSTFNPYYGYGPTVAIGLSGPAPQQGLLARTDVSSYVTGNINARSLSGNVGSSSISGGTTDLTSKEFGVYLTNSTTLTATGACRWEVIEFA